MSKNSEINTKMVDHLSSGMMGPSGKLYNEIKEVVAATAAAEQSLAMQQDDIMGLNIKQSRARVPATLMSSYNKLMVSEEGKAAMKRICVVCGICKEIRYYSMYRGITRIAGVIGCEICRHFYQHFNRKPYQTSCVGEPLGSCYTKKDWLTKRCKACWVIQIIENCPITVELYNAFKLKLPTEVMPNLRGSPPHTDEIPPANFGSLGLEIFRDGSWVDVTDISIIEQQLQFKENPLDVDGHNDDTEDDDDNDDNDDDNDEIVGANSDISMNENNDEAAEISEPEMSSSGEAEEEPKLKRTINKSRQVKDNKNDSSNVFDDDGDIDDEEEEDREEEEKEEDDDEEEEEEEHNDAEREREEHNDAEQEREANSDEQEEREENSDEQEDISDDHKEFTNDEDEHMTEHDENSNDQHESINKGKKDEKHIKQPSYDQEEHTDDEEEEEGHQVPINKFKISKNKVIKLGRESKKSKVKEMDVDSDLTVRKIKRGRKTKSYKRRSMDDFEDPDDPDAQNRASDSESPSNSTPAGQSPVSSSPNLSRGTSPARAAATPAVLASRVINPESINIRTTRGSTTKYTTPEDFALAESSPFLENFNPRNSERMRRKKEVEYFKKITQLSVSKKYGKAIYDGNGKIVVNGRDLCDCLQPDCLGCHFPCPKCRSSKCGKECRVNRKWYYEKVEVEGTKLYWTNSFVKGF